MIYESLWDRSWSHVSKSSSLRSTLSFYSDNLWVLFLGVGKHHLVELGGGVTFLSHMLHKICLQANRQQKDCSLLYNAMFTPGFFQHRTPLQGITQWLWQRHLINISSCSISNLFSHKLHLQENTECNSRKLSAVLHFVHFQSRCKTTSGLSYVPISLICDLWL